MFCLVPQPDPLTSVCMCFCVQFQLQLFDVICSTSWANRDKCCELPGLVSPAAVFGYDSSPGLVHGPGTGAGPESDHGAAPSAMCLYGKRYVCISFHVPFHVFLWLSSWWRCCSRGRRQTAQRCLEPAAAPRTARDQLVLLDPQYGNACTHSGTNAHIFSVRHTLFPFFFLPDTHSLTHSLTHSDLTVGLTCLLS